MDGDHGIMSNTRYPEASNEYATRTGSGSDVTLDGNHRQVTRKQARILTLDSQSAESSSPHHIIVAADITGPLDTARLIATLSHMTARHAALRTVFVRPAGTGPYGCREVPGWEPHFIEQHLPHQADQVDVVELVHRLLMPVASRLLRPYDIPPVIFVLTHVESEHAVLSLLTHEAAIDARSAGLIWEEIASTYSGSSRPDMANEPAPGMELVVGNEQAVLASGLVTQRAEMLADWPTTLELSGDLRRPASRTFTTARVSLGLTNKAQSGCAALADSLKVSRDTVVLAAWALAVARRTASSRLIVGIPTTGPTSAESRQVIGSTTGLVPVECEFPEDRSVTDFVVRTGQALHESMRYADIPFDDLADALSMEEDRFRNPLVQILFEPTRVPSARTISAGDVTFTVSFGSAGAAAYEASLRILCWEPAPVLELEYADSVLTPQEASDLASSLDQAVIEMAAGPAGRLAEIAAVAPGQRRRLDRMERGPIAECPDGLWQLIEAAADREPDAIAVRGTGTEDSLSYRQLREAAAAQSAELAAAGVREAGRVAIAVCRSVEEIVAIAAVLRIGAAYVGVDIDSPPAVLDAILESAGVEVILCDPAGREALGSAKDGRVTLSVIDPYSPLAGTSCPPAAADLDRIAYLAFTSGTSGPPKGAMIPCRAVVRLAYQPTYLSPGATDRFLRIAPLAFDASTLDIFPALLAGGTVEVFPARHIAVSDLAGFLQERRITGACLTTGMFRLMADFQPSAFAGLTQLVTGGDVVPPAQVGQVLRACPGLRLTVAYGPTENTTLTTVHHVDRATAVTSPLPIGRPIQGTGVMVLDPNGRAVPPGGMGELFTSGEGLATGYIGRPRETAEAFGDFGREGGVRLYRTGDLVRWDGDGNLTFIGRRDHQVKIRGFRVEADHVAATLREHPEVRDAAVFVIQGTNGDKQLLAAIITAHDRAFPATLQPFAAQRLPRYAMPQLWTAVGEYPVTRNGKVDVRRLAELAVPYVIAAPPEIREPAAPGQAQQAAPGGAEPAGGALEAVIADAWERVLGHRNFRYIDWFFDVGGDSLRLIHVHSILCREHPALNVTLDDLYASSTIEELAAILRSEADER
jgi:amino acid adenylation domain-containing protein